MFLTIFFYLSTQSRLVSSVLESAFGLVVTGTIYLITSTSQVHLKYLSGIQCADLVGRALYTAAAVIDFLMRLSSDLLFIMLLSCRKRIRRAQRLTRSVISLDPANEGQVFWA